MSVVALVPFKCFTRAKQRLRARYDDAQLVEIPFVVGQYTMLSMVANGTGVAVEPGLPELPEPPSR